MAREPKNDQQKAAREKAKAETLWHLARSGNTKAKEAVKTNAKGGKK